MKLLASLLLVSVGVPLSAATFNLNFLDSQGTDSVLYTGDPTNWLNAGCGTSANSGGYSYCSGQLYGDLLTGTRASVTSPSMPYFTSNGYQVDILNAQSQTIAILSISPSGGCNGSGGTVTCGVAVGFYTSLNGGPLSSSFTSSFASIPVLGTSLATGANQTALTLAWSDGRADNVNFQLAGQSTPEPATIGLVGAALVPLWLFRRGDRRKPVQTV